MQVIVEINGRQALPVRAIPLLTDWHGLSPDGLALILAGDSDRWPSFDGMTAHRLHTDGRTEAIPPRWWASWVVCELEATGSSIKAKQISHATGRQQWRHESLAQLPAGVFVWRDEFEPAHARAYGPESLRARSNPEGFDPSVHILNFNPHPDPYIVPPRLVLEGFERLIPAPLGPVESNSTPVAPSAPVVDSASSPPAWAVAKPRRYNGYTAPLYRLLAAAHLDGKPCPSARDVLEAWRIKTPAEIAKVLTDGVDYYDAKGDTKTANLEAIRKAIERRTSAR